jgi:hypothetical protein
VQQTPPIQKQSSFGVANAIVLFMFDQRAFFHWHESEIRVIFFMTNPIQDFKLKILRKEKQNAYI